MCLLVSLVMLIVFSEQYLYTIRVYLIYTDVYRPQCHVMLLRCGVTLIALSRVPWTIRSSKRFFKQVHLLYSHCARFSLSGGTPRVLANGLAEAKSRRVQPTSAFSLSKMFTYAMAKIDQEKRIERLRKTLVVCVGVRLLKILQPAKVLK